MQYLIISITIFASAIGQFSSNLGTKIGSEIRVDNSSHVPHCSPPVGTTDGRISVEHKDGQWSQLTSVRWHLGLDTTLCYKFNGDHGEGGTVEVTYVSLKSVYSVMDTYKFPLVQSSVSCLCDCPGGASHCQSGHNMCKNTTNCHTYYNPSVQSQGCFLHWMKLSSALCCQIKVSALPGQVFRAVRLGVPSLMATFKTVMRDRSGVVVDRRMFSVDLNTGAAIDWYVSIVISSGGHSPVLPPGWYVTNNNNVSPRTLYTCPRVNGLDEWDVTKLGWAKITNQKLVTHNLEQLSNYFRPAVDSCTRGDIKAHFPGVMMDQSDIRGRDVSHEFPFISQVHTWHRHVEVDHSQSPVLSLTLQHSSKVGVTVTQSPSHVQSFTGVLYQDRASHYYLNLTITRGVGVVTGAILGAGGSQQSLRLVLGSVMRNSSHQISVNPGVRCDNNKAEIVLRAIDINTETPVNLTQNVPCVSLTMRHVSVPTHVSGHVDIDTLDCVSCLDTWLYWLEPHNWFDTSWPFSRVIVNLVIVISFVLSVIIIAKMVNFVKFILKSGQSVFCCVCQKNSKKKREKLKKRDVLLTEFKDLHISKESINTQCKI